MKNGAKMKAATLLTALLLATTALAQPQVYDVTDNYDLELVFEPAPGFGGDTIRAILDVEMTFELEIADDFQKVTVNNLFLNSGAAQSDFPITDQNGGSAATGVVVDDFFFGAIWVDFDLDLNPSWVNSGSRLYYDSETRQETSTYQTVRFDWENNGFEDELYLTSCTGCFPPPDGPLSPMVLWADQEIQEEFADTNKFEGLGFRADDIDGNLTLRLARFGNESDTGVHIRDPFFKIADIDWPVEHGLLLKEIIVLYDDDGTAGTTPIETQSVTAIGHPGNPVPEPHALTLILIAAAYALSKR